MKCFVNRNKSVAAGLLIAGLSMLCACSGGGGGSEEVVSQTFGVVAMSNVGSIGILNGQTQALASVEFTGELGTYGGGLFDVAITPDGKTTLVSNFGDAKVFFINTTDPAAPVVLGSVTTSYMDDSTPPAEVKVFAEDIAITPDGRYALVTDGGFSTKIFVIDIASRTITSIFDDSDALAVPPINHQHQSVAVASDGKTVLTVDYWNSKVNVLTLSAGGVLIFVNALDVSVPVWDPVGAANVPTLRPVNVEISPDGKTAIVVGPAAEWKDVAGTIPADLAFPVLKIAGPGVVTLNQTVTSNTLLKGSQSVVFNRLGTRAYVMCTQPLPEPYPVDPLYPGPNNVIKVLNVTGQGAASDASVSVEVNIYGRSQLFGVDTLAMDNVGRYLYVSNPTLSGAKNYFQIVDTTTNTMIKQITFTDIDVPDDATPPVYTSTEPIAAGISFWRH